MSNVNPAISTVRNLKGKLDSLQRDVFKAGDCKSTEEEDEDTALNLLQGKLTELEFALIKMGGIERLGDTEKASIMAKIDSNRRDLLAAARECSPHVSSAGKDLVAAVVNFARLKETTEVISPRDFGVEWKTPAKTESTKNDLSRRLSIGSVTSSVRSEPLSITPLSSEGTRTMTQRQMAVLELEKKERAVRGADAARLKSAPVHNPGSQRAAALEGLNKAQQKVQPESKADGNKRTPLSGTSQRATAMKQLAPSLTGPSPPPAPPSQAAMRAQKSQATSKLPIKGTSLSPPLHKASDADSTAQSIFAESRKSTQDFNTSRASPPPSAPQQPASGARLTLADRMAMANPSPIQAPPATSIDLQLPPPPPPPAPSYLSAYERYRSSGGGAPPADLAPTPPLALAKTSMGGSSIATSQHHERQQQLSAAMEAALPTLHSLRLADPQRRGSGAGSVSSVNGPLAPRPHRSRPQSLSGYVRQPAIVDQYFNVEEEEDQEGRMVEARRSRGVLRKVLAAVGSALSLAVVTGGAVVAASLLNFGFDENASGQLHNSKRGGNVKVSRRSNGSSSPGSHCPPYLPNNAPVIFRG